MRLVRKKKEEEDEKKGRARFYLEREEIHIHVSARMFWSKDQECDELGGFTCKSTNSCISKSLVCDGRLHCSDGSDELQDCISKCTNGPSTRTIAGTIKNVQTTPNPADATSNMLMPLNGGLSLDTLKETFSCRYVILAPEGQFVNIVVSQGFNDAYIYEASCTPAIAHSKSDFYIIQSVGNYLMIEVPSSKSFVAHFSFSEKKLIVS